MVILSIGVITGIEKLEEAVHDVGVVFREFDSMLNPLLDILSAHVSLGCEV